MILIDVNLLLYAYDSSSSEHLTAKIWWEDALSATEIVGLPWHTILGFIRISTNHRILEQPFSLQQVTDIVDSWLSLPMVKLVGPDINHWQRFKVLLVNTQSPANYVPDAHLATLAIEYGATLYSTDRDFARFPGLQWRNPLNT